MTQVERDDDLYRRIFEYYVKAAGSVSSAAFKGKRGRLDPEVSVHLARLSNPRDILRAGPPKQLLAKLSASVPLDLGLLVRPDPIEGFPGHCVITDFGPNWKEQCARLATACVVVDLDHKAD